MKLEVLLATRVRASVVLYVANSYQKILATSSTSSILSPIIYFLVPTQYIDESELYNEGEFIKKDILNSSGNTNCDIELKFCC